MLLFEEYDVVNGSSFFNNVGLCGLIVGWNCGSFDLLKIVLILVGCLVVVVGVMVVILICCCRWNNVKDG